MRSATALLVVAAAAVIAWSTAALTLFRDGEGPLLLVAVAASWLLFAVALITLRRVPDRSVALLVIAGSVVIGAAGLAGPPNTSTDSARYAWDGLVTTSGVSPYDHVPADDALEDLRPEWLFPTPEVDAEGEASCSGLRIAETTTTGGEPLCTALNRPQVPTIYPPVAELYFAGVRAVVGPDAEYWPLQATGLLISLGVTLMLLGALRRRGLDPRWAALWGWCPLVATEAVNNSHVDLLGAALALAATLLVASGRRIAGGAALGAAIAAKLMPVIVAPPLLRRKPLAIVLSSVGVFALVYLPYVLASGPEVLGYLPGYLSEEGYSDGSRFALLTLVLPPAIATPVAAVLLAVIAGLAIWKADPDRPWMMQVVLIGSILLIVSPRYPWYGLLLLPFIALSGRAEWLVVPFALLVRQMLPSLTTIRIAVAVAAVVVVVVWLRRRRAEARGREPAVEHADA